MGRALLGSLAWPSGPVRLSRFSPLPAMSGRLRRDKSGLRHPGERVSEGGVSGQAVFIFVSKDGSISGWAPTVAADHAIIALDDGDEGAVYKGAALVSHRAGCGSS